MDAGLPSWYDIGFFNLAKLVSHLYPGRQRERHQGARPGGQAHRLLKHCEDFESANSDFVEPFKVDDSEVGDGMELS